MPDDPTQPASAAEAGATPPASAAPAASNPAAEMANDALIAAQQAVAALSDEAAAGDTPSAAPAPEARPEDVRPFVLPDLGAGASAEMPAGVSLLSDVNLNVKIELGRTMMLVEDVLRLAEGAVVELDKLAGDPVDVYVNDRHIARGEVLVLNDNFCVRISEILAPVKLQEPAAADAAA
jgi:flagellar motor switch protein FliN/FliY